MILPLLFGLIGNHLGVENALNVDDGTHEFKLGNALVGMATVCAPFETILLVTETEEGRDGVEEHKELTPRNDGPPFRWFAAPVLWHHPTDIQTPPDLLRATLEGKGATKIQVLAGVSSLGKAPVTNNTPKTCVWDKRDYEGGSMEACLYMEGGQLHSVGRDESDALPLEYHDSWVQRNGFFRQTDLRDFMKDQDARYSHTVFSISYVVRGDGVQIPDPCAPPPPPPVEPERPEPEEPDPEETPVEE